MSGIDEYFGYSEPVKKEEPKKEKSLQERVNAISEIGTLSLGKTSDYFEEAYKGLEPDPVTDKVIEEMFYESSIEPKNEPEMDYTMRRYHNKLSEILRYK